MSHETATHAAGPQKIVIRNLGLVLSGALENPILDADTIMAVGGRITFIGRGKDADVEAYVLHELPPQLTPRPSRRSLT